MREPLTGWWSTAIRHDFRRIGIDTGAYLTGKLTAACLVGSEVKFITT